MAIQPILAAAGHLQKCLLMAIEMYLAFPWLIPCISVQPTIHERRSLMGKTLNLSTSEQCLKLDDGLVVPQVQQAAERSIHNCFHVTINQL